MLEYYKLMLVKAGDNRATFTQVVRHAFLEMPDPQQRKQLKDWFRKRAQAT